MALKGVCVLKTQVFRGSPSAPVLNLAVFENILKTFFSNSRNLGTHLPTSTSLAIAWVPTLLGRQDGEPMGPLDGSQVGQNSESLQN